MLDCLAGCLPRSVCLNAWLSACLLAICFPLSESIWLFYFSLSVCLPISHRVLFGMSAYLPSCTIQYVCLSTMCHSVRLSFFFVLVFACLSVMYKCLYVSLKLCLIQHLIFTSRRYASLCLASRVDSTACIVCWTITWTLSAMTLEPCWTDFVPTINLLVDQTLILTTVLCVKCNTCNILRSLYVK